MAVSKLLEQAIKKSVMCAKQTGESKVETEHLLYGILSISESKGARLLGTFGIQLVAYKKVILSYLKNKQIETPKSVGYSKNVTTIFAKTTDFCKKQGRDLLEIEDILYILISNQSFTATKHLKDIFKINLDVLKAKIEKVMGYEQALVAEPKEVVSKPVSGYKFELPEELKSLGIDLTQKVASSDMAKIIGRDEETARLIEILCRKTKNNPVLIGEPGVGKSSVVEGLAQRLVTNDVPEILQGKMIFSLDLASLMAGTKFRGSMEQKLKNAINAILENQNILVFIDEIHMLAEAGKEGEISASDILKPYLARGELHCIGATTLDEYKKYIEKDPALERRFQPVKVEEPTAEDTIKILKGIRSSFENFHNVKIADDAVDAAVNLSIRYITNRYLPDKAIDLIDEACSKLRVNASEMPDEVRELSKQIFELDRKKEEFRKKDDFVNADKMNKQKAVIQNRISEIRKEILLKTGETFGEVSAENIREVVAAWTNIPVKKLTSSERETLLNLENILSERVIGQPGAVSVVSKAIRRSRADINDPKRPIGSFLFLGPTGVGKTELTKAIADVLFDNEDSIIRFDMSEFMESHSVSRLIGAPPGYVGHEDGGELTEAVRKKPYSIVLFDEIEKAHSDIFNIMLQIFDEGRLTDSSGKVVSFKNTLIILTSNNGVQDLLARRKFEREHPEQKTVETEEFLMDKLRDNFKPELLNRIDSVVIFDSLQKDSIMKIADIMLNSLEKRFVKKNISLEITTPARILICDKGYDEMYGARPLKRVIDKEIKDPLAEMIISGELQDNSAVKVDANGTEFEFKVLC
ncbi:MAG: ATP-dependent Clp protease ATP-binding subunit [Clostridia bacterium]|nr:ATP-dependent Clp protease ATP-binding subunit [Clostridia bacterium]